MDKASWRDWVSLSSHTGLHEQTVFLDNLHELLEPWWFWDFWDLSNIMKSECSVFSKLLHTLMMRQTERAGSVFPIRQHMIRTIFSNIVLFVLQSVLC